MVFIVKIYNFIMETQNEYSYPIDSKLIEKMITSESPAHRKYDDKDTSYDLTNAVDFLCIEGSPIMAASDGEVVRLMDGLTKNYNKFEPPSEVEMPVSEQDGNFVLMNHSNNEFSIYSHLQKNRIMIKVGQIVRRGDVVGYSGNSGWSIKPHLHFMVFRFLKPFPARDLESLKIRWKTD
jgi:murein DD-endopeptidase MepM/ murein hydrolase activator NlpD